MFAAVSVKNDEPPPVPPATPKYEPVNAKKTIVSPADAPEVKVTDVTIPCALSEPRM